LRRKVTPDYAAGCKRILLSGDYYPALTRPHVEVIPGEVREVRAHGVVDADGREREVDAIIYGTGFKAQEMLPRGGVFGRGGLDIADAWRDGPEAYKGTTVAGFPNLFLMIGPNTGLGHSSMIYMIEAQAAYIVDAIRQIRDNKWLAVDVDAAAQAAYNRALQDKHAGAIWQTGCMSWYLGKNGKNTALWPGFTFRFRRDTARFDAGNYRIDGAR